MQHLLRARRRASVVGWLAAMIAVVGALAVWSRATASSPAYPPDVHVLQACVPVGSVFTVVGLGFEHDARVVVRAQPDGLVRPRSGRADATGNLRIRVRAPAYIPDGSRFRPLAVLLNARPGIADREDVVATAYLVGTHRFCRMVAPHPRSST